MVSKVVWWGGGGDAHLVTCNISCLSFSSLPLSYPLCPLLHSSPRPIGVGIPRLWSVRSSGRSGHEEYFKSRLAKFQTPTVFDRDLDFYCSTFYRYAEIMKIIIYILYVHKNVSYNLIPEILSCECGYVVISFQSYKISIYIDIPRWFLNPVDGDYKIQSHGK